MKDGRGVQLELPAADICQIAAFVWVAGKGETIHPGHWLWRLRNMTRKTLEVHTFVWDSASVYSKGVRFDNPSDDSTL